MNENKDVPEKEEIDSGYVDVAKLDVQCHIVVKDKDTGEVLLNKRG